MGAYYYIAIILIALQVLFLLLCFRNYRYVLLKHGKKRLWQSSPVGLIVPCKGIDAEFDKNITSLLKLNYENYVLLFVVAEESDPAYGRLSRLIDRHRQTSRARDIRILVAGRARTCSQKIHNLLYAYQQVAEKVETLAFVDSDVCVRPDWLAQLVWPLRQSRYGASTGYRWFIPKNNNLAELALSSMNGKVAQLLGNTPFNQAWGGSMAIRADTFRRVGLDRLWPKVLSDDLSLTYAVKKAGMKLAFVPACIVPTYLSTSWPELFEFARRQFLITRIYRPSTWFFGLCSSLFSVLCLWPTAALAGYAINAGAENASLYVAVPVVSLACQAGRAILRQKMIGTVIPEERDTLRWARLADVTLSWAWSALMFALILSSAFGRTICWRGIRYKLFSTTKTVILPGESNA